METDSRQQGLNTGVVGVLEEKNGRKERWESMERSVERKTHIGNGRGTVSHVNRF